MVGTNLTSIYGTELSIPDKSDDAIGSNATLSEVSKGGYRDILDFKNATLSGVKMPLSKAS
jgi:hypothetical protein